MLEDSNQYYFDFQQFNFVNTDGEVRRARLGAGRTTHVDVLAQLLGTSPTVQSILLALVHNLYFRGLIIENYRFDKVRAASRRVIASAHAGRQDTFAALAHLLSYNGCFDTLLLDGINGNASGKAAGDGMT